MRYPWLDTMKACQGSIALNVVHRYTKQASEGIQNHLFETSVNFAFLHLKNTSCQCEVQKCCGSVNVGIAVESLKSHSIPSYKTILKLRTSPLIQFCDCCFPTLQQRSSRAWARKEGLFLPGEYCEETLLWWTTKLDLELIITGGLQLLVNSDRRKITNIKSIQKSKQMK